MRLIWVNTLLCIAVIVVAASIYTGVSGTVRLIFSVSSKRLAPNAGAANATRAAATSIFRMSALTAGSRESFGCWLLGAGCLG